MAEARERLALIGRPARTLAPGRYRAYLAPAAMEEIAALLCWGGFSARALATKQSALVADAGRRARSTRACRSARTRPAASRPRSRRRASRVPPRVPLIERGRLVGSLVSPRTAREFDLPENGANGAEMPESLAMAGGTLAAADALAALDTGLAVGNLHYLNYSDRPACRMTGMTRFATFWVEHGKVVAPVDVLRFDDTALPNAGREPRGADRARPSSSSTPGRTSRGSSRACALPGALLSEMAFTL